jgi:hypothetical protein
MMQSNTKHSASASYVNLDGRARLSKQVLKIYNLSDRHSGLTPHCSGSFIEAATVCLEKHHSSPADFKVINEEESFPCEVEWISPDKRTCCSYANDTDAIEAGAYALSLATVEVARGLLAVARAETLTGADFYVGPSGSLSEDLENCYRFEVSGVDHGDEKVVRRRLGAKLDQTLKGKSNLPAIACVTGFKVKVVAMAELKET